MSSSSWLLDSFNDTEKEVANIMLELYIPRHPVIKPVVPEWRFRGKRSAINIEYSPSSTAKNHSVASQVENSSCAANQGEASKPVSCDHKHVETEENYSEIKAEGAAASPGLEVEPIKTPCNNPNANLRIKIKPKSPGIQIKDVDQTSKQKAENHPEDVMVINSEKTICIDKRVNEASEERLAAELAVPKSGLVRKSEKIEEEPTRVVEATDNPITPQRKPAKRKSREELENEVTLFENHKVALVESIHKVKDYWENKKALNLELKACKLRLSSSKEKTDSR